MKKFQFLLLGAFLLGLSAMVGAQTQQYPAYQNNETYSAGRINWQTDYNSAVGLSKTTSKPIVILFTGTNWCPACMRLEKDVLTKSEFANGVGDKFIFLKAEFPTYSAASVAASPYKPLMDRYGVESFPTMIVIDATGQKLYSVSYQSGGADAYVNALLNQLNQTRTTPSSMTYTY